MYMGLRHIDHIATLIPGMDEERASVEAGRDTVSQDIVRTEALEKAALKVTFSFRLFGLVWCGLAWFLECCVCMYACLQACICMYVCTLVCLHVCLYVCRQMTTCEAGT